jgi:hypothetical protein
VIVLKRNFSSKKRINAGLHKLGKRRKRSVWRSGRTVARNRKRKPLKRVLHAGAGPLPLHVSGTVGVVISAMNEEGTIGEVLKELNRLPLHEVIVVVNGSTDGTFQEAKQTCGPNGLILYYPEPLGYDVGRSAGVRVAQSDILLFLDGDFVVPAEKLVSFIMAVERGADIALNDLTPYSGVFRIRDEVTMVKEFLNRSLGRSDLGINSLTAVPHALSRRAIEVIGPSRLAIPPLAQAAAIRSGLRVMLSTSVNVYGPNRVRASNTGLRNPVARLIIGDHLEALHGVMETQGIRLGFQDNIRKRQHASGERA